MELNKKIIFIYNSNQCKFKSINRNDVTQEYIDGLKKEKQYLSNIPENVNIESQSYYISKIIESKKDAILGLFVDSRLIGTAGIQNISKNSTATIGIFIFSQEDRGKGFGKILVWASCLLAHDCFGIIKFAAGMEKTNLPSLNSFLSCGFTINSRKNTIDNYWVNLKIKNLVKPEMTNDIFIRLIEKEKV